MKLWDFKIQPFIRWFFRDKKWCHDVLNEVHFPRFDVDNFWQSAIYSTYTSGLKVSCLSERLWWSYGHLRFNHFVGDFFHEKNACHQIMNELHSLCFNALCFSLVASPCIDTFTAKVSSWIEHFWWLNGNLESNHFCGRFFHDKNWCMKKLQELFSHWSDAIHFLQFTSTSIHTHSAKVSSSTEHVWCCCGR